MGGYQHSERPDYAVVLVKISMNIAASPYAERDSSYIF
jgi:hypothetical protein